MIRVLCLNPAIDKMYYIDHFKAGVPSYRNHPETYAAGKGFNILKALCAYGEKPVLYAFIGGANGQRIVEETEHLGASGVFFTHPGETRMTINIIDRAEGQETEIKEEGSAIEPGAQEAFLARLTTDLQEGDLVICSGRPANGMTPDIYRRVSKVAEEKGALCALDTSMEFLFRALPGKYCLIKPNEEELQSLFASSGSAGSDLQQAKLLLGRGAERVLLSMGSKGALYVDSERTIRVEIPAADVVSTIGSGDACVAGFGLGLAHGFSAEECIRLSMAFGISNVLHSEAGHIEKEEVEKLLPRISLREE